jgi:hypothetical protein
MAESMRQPDGLFYMASYAVCMLYISFSLPEEKLDRDERLPRSL